MAIQYSNVRQHGTDWDFTDPTNPRKHYIVSFDEGCWCGTVQTSKTDDGCFDGDEPMDIDMVRELRALIPNGDLPINSEHRV